MFLSLSRSPSPLPLISEAGMLRGRGTPVLLVCRVLEPDRAFAALGSHPHLNQTERGQRFLFQVSDTSTLQGDVLSRSGPPS